MFRVSKPPAAAPPAQLRPRQARRFFGLADRHALSLAGPAVFTSAASLAEPLSTAHAIIAGATAGGSLSTGAGKTAAGRAGAVTAAGAKTDDDTVRQLVLTLAHAIVFIASICCFSRFGGYIRPFLLERASQSKPGRPEL